jgi:hypothetical protein
MLGTTCPGFLEHRVTRQECGCKRIRAVVGTPPFSSWITSAWGYSPDLSEMRRTTAVPGRLAGLNSATGSSRRKRIRCARDPKRTAMSSGSASCGTVSLVGQNESTYFDRIAGIRYRCWSGRRPCQRATMSQTCWSLTVFAHRQLSKTADDGYAQADVMHLSR